MNMSTLRFFVAETENGDKLVFLVVPSLIKLRYISRPSFLPVPISSLTQTIYRQQ